MYPVSCESLQGFGLFEAKRPEIERRGFYIFYGQFEFRFVVSGKTPAVLVTRQLKVFQKTVSAKTTISLRRHRTVWEFGAPAISLWIADHWRIAASAARLDRKSTRLNSSHGY